ncbi:MAG: TetR/AcrR family transcriptional regulator [Acidimicrobiales bacterium]
MTASTGLRARVRAELIDEIKNEARRQIDEVGAQALSLRAIARQLNMVSSAIYRYFPSRDQLLTALIVDGYNAMGAAVEEADASCRRDDISARWTTDCRAVRAWALEHPQEYGLVYGSPVPGYVAPQDTVVPASRVALVFASLLHDAAQAGMLSEPFKKATETASSRAIIESVRSTVDELDGLSDEVIVRSLVAWTQLFGLVSFELYGHLHGVVDDLDAFFDSSVKQMGIFVGLLAHDVS